jgi:hypothetical protein
VLTGDTFAQIATWRLSSALPLACVCRLIDEFSSARFSIRVTAIQPRIESYIDDDAARANSSRNSG